MSKLAKSFNFGGSSGDGKKAGNLAKHLIKKAERSQLNEFKDKLSENLKKLEAAYKNKENIRHFTEEQVKFKEFIATNWYFFKKITQDDIETRNKMMEVFAIENSFSYGFQKLAANSTDELVRYFYAVVFIVFLGYSFSDLFTSTIGMIMSYAFGVFSLPLYVWLKIRFRMWESYMSASEAFNYYLKCVCCLKKKFKLKK
jgi:hypothetical protein